MAGQFEVVELVVDDMAATLAFYRLLGLEIPAEAQDSDHVEVPLGGLRLAFDTVETIRSFDPGWQSPSGGPRTSLAMRFDAPSEVDTQYRALTDAGYPGHKEPWDAPWGMRYAIAADPDGNHVDFFAALD